MSCWRPATPGFLTTFAATILLAVVSFSVPWFKTVYFLKASLAVENTAGTITFGVLGYCLEMGDSTTCSKAAIGYELDVNQLLGNKLPVQIPTVVVKWITYALVLHIVALCLAAVSAVFGLLAHIREMSMTCFSSCISGFAAAIALLAFIFDLVLFFLAKARMNKVPGGSATMGNAIWLTLAAWVLLFVSGCMFTFGRCCIQNRTRAPRDAPPKRIDSPITKAERGQGYDNYAETMRLDAVKAEADRKARQHLGNQELGLPAFHERERLPLRRPSEPQYLEEDDEDDRLHAPYSDHPNRPANVSVATTAGVAGVGTMQNVPAARSPPPGLPPMQTAAAISTSPRRQATSEGPMPPGAYAQAGPSTRVEAFPEKPPISPVTTHTSNTNTYPPQPYQQSAATTSGNYLQDPYAQGSHPSHQEPSVHSQAASFVGYGQDTYAQPQQEAYPHSNDPSYYSAYSQHQQQGYASPVPDYTSQPDYAQQYQYQPYQPYQPDTSAYANSAAGQLYDFNSNPYSASATPMPQANQPAAAGSYYTTPYNAGGAGAPSQAAPPAPGRQQSLGGPRGPRLQSPPGY